MNIEDLRLIRLQAQHLLHPTAPLDAAGDLCGLQAQFLRNAVHALRLRAGVPEVAGLVKTWTLRGTVHLLPERDLPVYLPHCGTAEDVCSTGWYTWRAKQGNAPAPDRERFLARTAFSAIAAGSDTREGLRALLRDAGMTEAEEAHAFDPWGGLIREMAEAGVLAFRVDMDESGRPVEEKRYRLLAPFVPMAPHAARIELLRRYIAHYGPVTLRDTAYFLHWTQAEIRALLPETGAEAVICEGRTYFRLPCPTENAATPPVILLAGFDPLMMGYRKEENPFLPSERLRGIFNLAGIVHPAILLRGQVAGRWKEKDGRVEMTAFAPLTARDRRCIEDEAARLFTIRRITWNG